jgi:anti-anti-sigma factor
MASAGSVIIEDKMGFTWVVLPNAVNMDSCPAIEKEIGRVLVRSGESARVVVDLSLTRDLYSTGMGLLIRLRKRLFESKGSIDLVNVSQRIRDLLEAVHLDKIFPLYATDVEFEISQEQFAKRLGAHKYGFVFVARIEDGIFRINCSGSMTAEQDLSAISRFKRNETVTHYLFDFVDLDTADSTGAAILIRLFQDIHEHGAASYAYGANQGVAELIEILGMDEYVTLVADERSALAAVRGKKK